MRVLFHNKTLNYRGVTNSIVDYAKYNHEILGNESDIIYNRTFDTTNLLDAGSVSEVIDKISKDFKVLTYDDNTELNKIAEKYDVVYTQKAGFRDNDNIESTKWAVHCVFQYCDPHGDSYAYISEWLAKESTKNMKKDFPFVPYVVNLPPIIPGLREKMRDVLGIPQDAFVIGRHGGKMTFDIQWVNWALPLLCNKYPNLWFLMANTDPVFTHERIKFVKPFFGAVDKTVFISACDAAIHGRTLGESFGASICENLFHNKPVIAWEDGFDRNHIELLKDYDLLYNEKNLPQKIERLIASPYWDEVYDFSKTMALYTPQKVMAKFNEVFLS